MRFIDIEVESSPDTPMARALDQRGTSLFEFEGPSVGTLREKIEDGASALGYSVVRSDGVTSLRRGEQVVVLSMGPRRLSVRVDDAERLPRSRLSQNGIAIGDISIRLASANSIVSGRERHDPTANELIGDWRVYGVRPKELLTTIHDELVRQGLRGGGVWDPARDSTMPHWMCEASSIGRFVKAYATEGDNCVNLQVIVVE